MKKLIGVDIQLKTLVDKEGYFGTGNFSNTIPRRHNLNDRLVRIPAEDDRMRRLQDERIKTLDDIERAIKVHDYDKSDW